MNKKLFSFLIIASFILFCLVYSSATTTYIYENIAVTGVQLDTDGTFAANSDARVPSQKAVKTYADTMVPLSYLDTDGALTANSDVKVPSQKAVKTYADTKIPSSYLDTDGALAANSDVKVASQKAVKTYADTKAAGPGATTSGYIPLWQGTLGLSLQAGVQLDTDGVLTANSDTKIASQKAVKTYADTKAAGPGATTSGYIPLWQGTLGLSLQAGVQLDTDGALTANSDTKVASQKAVKTYADTKAAGPGATTTGYIPLWQGTLGLSLQAGVQLDTDGTLAANSDTRVASQKAIKTYASTERIAWKTASAELTTTEGYGYTIMVQSTGGPITLPAGSVGMKLKIMTDTDNQILINRSGSDVILIRGTGGLTGIKNTSAKGGDFIVLLHNTTSKWDARFESYGTWNSQ